MKIIFLSFVHLKVVSITTTTTTTTPTSPLASSSWLEVSSCLWEWASTTGCWSERGKRQRRERGRRSRRSVAPCWRLLLPLNQMKTWRRTTHPLPSHWMRSPGWTRTLCRKSLRELEECKTTASNMKHTRESLSTTTHHCYREKKPCTKSRSHSYTYFF